MPINFYKEQIHSPPQYFNPAPIKKSSRKAKRSVKNKHNSAVKTAAKSSFNERLETISPEPLANNKLQRAAIQSPSLFVQCIKVSSCLRLELSHITHHEDTKAQSHTKSMPILASFTQQLLC